MIRVLVPQKAGKTPSYLYDIIFDTEQPLDGRPYISDFYGKNNIHLVYLPDYFHFWLKDLGISYKLKNEYYKEGKIIKNFYYIIFENESDAILFKLTWF